MPKSSRPVFPPWPAVMAAITYGVLEWLALSRSRLHDHLAARRLVR
jgi:hypothetical protein